MIKRLNKILFSSLILLVVVHYSMIAFGAEDENVQDLVIYEMNRGTREVLAITLTGDTTVFFTVSGQYVIRIFPIHRTGIVAILSQNPGKLSTDGFLYVVQPRKYLDIVDKHGQLISSNQLQIGDLVFDPTGQMLAFLAGPLIQDKDMHYSPRRLGILDIKSKKVSWIVGDSSAVFSEDGEVGYDLNWSNNGKLYMNGWNGLVEVNLSSKKIIPTGLPASSDFSPDGKYLLVGAKRPYGSDIELFRVSDGANISDTLYDLLGTFDLTSSSYMPRVGWYAQTGSILYVDMKPLRPQGQNPVNFVRKREAFIVDIPSKTVLFHDESGEIDFETFSEVVTNIPYVIIRNGNLQLLDSSAIELIQRNGSD